MFTNIFLLNLKWIVRDKMLQALFGVALFLVLLVPVISSFSMRQTQELAITLSLSIISFVLLVLTVLLGGTAIWRDIEKRYTTSVLTLPMSRGVYLLGKFFAISFFIACCMVFLATVSAGAISIIAARFPGDSVIQWSRIGLAFAADLCKYVMLTSVTLLFSALSTSFFLPFFGTISLFLAGSASQDVFEYVSGDYGEKIGPVALCLIKFAYYLIPNFGAFDYHLAAIYPISIDVTGLLYSFVYFCVYTSSVLSLAVWIFSQRELP